MKLRIRENSVRLRLTQSEVEQLSLEGRVENTTPFASGELSYMIAESRGDENVNADFRNNELVISVPSGIIAEWAGSEQVGIEAAQAVPNGELYILIEKDFPCLKPRAGEEDTDTFANPLAAGDQ